MNVLYFLSQLRTPAADIFFQAVTWIGQELFVVAVICWLFWCADKKLAYSLGFAYFFSGLLVQGLKIAFRVPRPWILDPGFLPVASAMPGATGYSFPSGHTQSVTAMFGTLAFHLKKPRLKVLCFGVIAAVMLSRMYLGVHTPADVGVSFLLTLGCAAVNYFYIYKKNLSLNESRGLLSVMLLATAGLGVFALTLSAKGIIEQAYASDCLKACGAGAAFCAGYAVENRWIRFSPPSSLPGGILRFLAGTAGALAVLEGMKPFLGSSLPACFLRYFLAVLWILVLYPAIFSGIRRRKKE